MHSASQSAQCAKHKKTRNQFLFQQISGTRVRIVLRDSRVSIPRNRRKNSWREIFSASVCGKHNNYARGLIDTSFCTFSRILPPDFIEIASKTIFGVDIYRLSGGTASISYNLLLSSAFCVFIFGLFL